LRDCSTSQFESSGSGQTQRLAPVSGIQASQSAIGSSTNGGRAYISIKEAADRLGVSESTFHRIRDEQWMPRPLALSPQVIRYSVAELDEAIKLRAPRVVPGANVEPVALTRSREAGRITVRNGKKVAA
jgi:predicted DNA-binding transcriptional regulator AlpA